MKHVIRIERVKGGTSKMREFTKKFEQIFTAITFAEAGEFGTAEQIMKEETKDQEHSSTHVVPEGACFIAPGTKS